MTNRERFFAGHPFELHGQIAKCKLIYSTYTLMVDNLQTYYCFLFVDRIVYEKPFTPFDSKEAVRFEDLKFIDDVEN